MKTSCSPNVQRVLRLRLRAAALRATHAEGLARITPTRHRAERLEQEARVIKGRLNPWERAELRRSHAG